MLMGRHVEGTVETEVGTWQIGLIADLHFGLAPDALGRLRRFMAAVEEKRPDCILQLGDFNYGVDSQECMREWCQFNGPRYHVLGNHDMDKATKTEMVNRWEMPGSYYSWDYKGWHLVVIDRNHLWDGDKSFVDYADANFYVDSHLRGYASPDQLEWLADDLEKTSLPTVVFSHQGLGMDTRREPSSAAGMIESILESANEKGQRKVRACFCGHHHIDRYNFRQGIHYVWVNSASYYWVGEEFGRMAAYTDPLFTFLTFCSDGQIEVEARTSDWAEPTPRERGFPNWEQLNTVIRHRTLV